MKIAIIAFTRNGAQAARKISKWLLKEGNICEAYALGENAICEELITVKTSLGVWVERAFNLNDAIIFIGAAGIAVRAIGPHMKSKATDPAVIVADEKGQYFIPILSGHIGGANALAKRLEGALGGKAIITTATDINQVFAVDTWAKGQGLHICSMAAAKKVSAKLLVGGPVYLYSQYHIEGDMPSGILEVDRENAIEMASGNEMADDGCTIVVISHEALGQIQENCLQLAPKTVFVGIGCKKNIEIAAVEELLQETLTEHKILKESLALMASIDLKKEEKALIELSKRWGLPFVTYGAEELLSIEGNFTASHFVERVTGVDNVCERSAVRASQGGSLILKKKSKEGVTIALAINKLMLNFS